ncbi:hypothetical protein LINGRAHAP2_LOCUS30603 [Linum grandiflorum]
MDVISFHLGGSRRNCSLDEFGIALGFYTHTESATANLAIFTGKTSPASETFWGDVAPSSRTRSTKTRRLTKYSSSSSKARRIERPILCFLHGVLRHLITQRPSCDGVVNVRDLYLLQSLHIGRKTDLAPFTATLLKNQREKGNKNLYGGAYVTRLIKHFHCQGSFGLLSMMNRIGSFPITSSITTTHQLPDDI